MGGAKAAAGANALASEARPSVGEGAVRPQLSWARRPNYGCERGGDWVGRGGRGWATARGGKESWGGKQARPALALGRKREEGEKKKRKFFYFLFLQTCLRFKQGLNSNYTTLAVHSNKNYAPA